MSRVSVRWALYQSGKTAYKVIMDFYVNVEIQVRNHQRGCFSS